MPNRFAVGVDVGATKILAGVIDRETGEVVSSAKNASPLQGADAIVSAIVDTIAETLSEAPRDVADRVRRIGIGVPGQVDSDKGVLLLAPNLGGGIRDVPLVKPLNDRFKMKVILGNDVEVAALGEARFGAGKGSRLFACVFVGTGIGGALVVDGKRFGGAAGSAGEIGHIMVRAGGRLCGCGQRGHLEAYASRTAMVEIMREEVEGGAVSSIGDLLLDTSQRVKSKPLADAVEKGDSLVLTVINEAGLYLGMGLSSLINLWSPERIVIGGGVVDRIDLLFEVAAEQAKSRSLPVAAKEVEIVRSALGDNSGIVGAALLEGQD